MKNLIFFPIFFLLSIMACKKEESTSTTDCDQKGYSSIDFNGKLYVQPAGSPGFTDTHDWQGAVDYCNNLDFDGCDDWFLPSKEELAALYANKATIANWTGSKHWSSTISSTGRSWAIDLSTGLYYPDYHSEIRRCRCVRR